VRNSENIQKYIQYLLFSINDYVRHLLLPFTNLYVVLYFAQFINIEFQLNSKTCP